MDGHRRKRVRRARGRAGRPERQDRFVLDTKHYRIGEDLL